ncbi:MAG: hypothetical protein D6696_18325 [Acidobacteria bacterium]|nr:MAG: hypothetical protein D6696_18325 [Acidobacteriota bacterium]
MGARRLAFAAAFLLLAPAPARAQPPAVLDLAGLEARDGVLLRLHGAGGSGAFGVPVAGGFDLDGDGHGDLALASMVASPFARTGAGEVYVLFGDGTVGGTYDAALAGERLLRITGDGPREATGSEIWIDDVTGDGLGDLLICRQNFAPTAARTGAGALTIVAGSPALRALAAAPAVLDLRSPPAGVVLTHVVGRAATDRFCIWVRTGDADGDGIADLAAGADQEDQPGAQHAGAVYLLRGGAHLASGQTFDLLSFDGGDLVGRVARITAPAGGSEFHFGATVQLADLDGNGRAELLAAATLNRAGAAILADGAPPGSAHASGGTAAGTLYVVWDDSFAGAWPAGFTFAADAPPGGSTVIDGGAANVSFGEEILGGLDYDGDGTADLFVGDLLATASGRVGAGLGHVFYRAADLKGLVFGVDAPPPALLPPTAISGPIAGAIAADTAMHGDLDGDGAAELVIAAPHAAPLNRRHAGALYALRGGGGRWPARVDLAAPAGLRITEVRGARGSQGLDQGDTLGYSGTAADLDGDGRHDVVSNEMLGNGLAPGTTDAGNLIVLSGAAFVLFDDGFESGGIGRWSSRIVAIPLP